MGGLPPFGHACGFQPPGVGPASPPVLIAVCRRCSPGFAQAGRQRERRPARCGRRFPELDEQVARGLEVEPGPVNLMADREQVVGRAEAARSRWCRADAEADREVDWLCLVVVQPRLRCPHSSGRRPAQPSRSVDVSAPTPRAWPVLWPEFASGPHPGRGPAPTRDAVVVCGVDAEAWQAVVFSHLEPSGRPGDTPSSRTASGDADRRPSHQVGFAPPSCPVTHLLDVPGGGCLGHPARLRGYRRSGRNGAEPGARPC